jgi:hypothetical protein
MTTSSNAKPLRRRPRPIAVMPDLRRKRKAGDRADDLRLIDQIVDEHLSIAFGTIFSALAKRNPNGSTERAVEDIYAAMARKANERMSSLGLR